MKSLKKYFICLFIYKQIFFEIFEYFWISAGSNYRANRFNPVKKTKYKNLLYLFLKICKKKDYHKFIRIW